MKINLNLNVRLSMGSKKESRKKPRDRPFEEGVGIISWLNNILISIPIVISVAFHEHLMSLPGIIMMV
ncbi:hypothetical protein [Vreelandella titanicae]|uniref:hypothetical protein n=1 Tax=Vreelandella titanicae TaxID=664683 RepID=UPI00382B13BC